MRKNHIMAHFRIFVTKSLSFVCFTQVVFDLNSTSQYRDFRTWTVSIHMLHTFIIGSLNQK